MFVLTAPVKVGILMMLLLGIVIGAALVGAAWGINELRWSWKLSHEIYEYSDLSEPNYRGRHV